MVNKIKKFEKSIFYLLILFLPTQLGKHFWPDFSFVYGLRIDYLSPTIYFTDLLIITLFLSFLLRVLINNRKVNLKLLSGKAWVLVYFFSILCGVIISKNPLAGGYGFLKLIEFIFFGIYTSKILREKGVFKNVVFLFSVSAIFQSLLAIGQFINQGSFGGLFYLFGERSFNGQTPGIANATLFGELVLRPYATFSHPNALSAFLLIFFILMYFGVIDYKRKVTRIIYGTGFLTGTMALFLTMSRTAIVLFFIFSIIILRKEAIKKYFYPVLIVMLIIFSLSPISSRLITFNMNELAFKERIELAYLSIVMIKNNFLLGAGLNNHFFYDSTNFINFKNFYLQPVHNIYLLIFQQTGVIGFIFFTLFLKKSFNFLKKKRGLRKIANLKLSLIVLILILGFFDHYFLTIQQGQILFAFVFGLTWARINTLS